MTDIMHEADHTVFTVGVIRYLMPLNFCINIFASLTRSMQAKKGI